jgi:predicted ATP-grasp superfamily ATP-dependent carboligase
VLLLDGHSAASLAFTRSLGRAGVRVTVADFRPATPARLSRYCARFVLYPSPLDEPENFRHWLLRELSQGNHEVLIGTTDFTMPLIDQWMDEIAAHVRVLFPGREGFRLAYDKAATLRLAAEAGVEIPPTYWLSSCQGVEELARSARWPLVIKGISSVVSRGGRRVSPGVEYAWNADEFRRRFAAMHAISPWPLVQEYVAGEGLGCFFLRHQGEILARFQHRRIRDIRPTGSGSCLRESVPPDAALMERSERLMRRMNWEGLCMVEFKQTPDGKPFLMEVNPRPWGSMQLAIEAGVDFPLLWYRLGIGEKIEPVINYKTGIRCRSLVGDFKHLESVLYGPPAGWQLPFPRRLAAISAFLRISRPAQHYDDFAARDWRPGIADLGIYFRGLAGRVFRGLRRFIRPGARAVRES